MSTTFTACIYLNIGYDFEGIIAIISKFLE